METDRNFLVDSRGHCFLCLAGVPTTTTSAKKCLSTGSLDKAPVAAQLQDEDKNLSAAGAAQVPIPPKIFSLHHITKYLKLKWKKALRETLAIFTKSSPLPLKGSELSGTLCDQCAQLSQTFSGYWRELVEVQEKLDGCLRQIYGRMEAVGVGGELEEFQKEMLGKPETIIPYRIVEGLRKATLEQCSRMLNITPPPPPPVNIFPKPPGPKVVTDEEDGDEIQVVETPAPPEIVPDYVDLTAEGSNDLDGDSLKLEDEDEDSLEQMEFTDPQPPSSPKEPGNINDLDLLTSNEDAKPTPVECDICHLEVTDLLAHLTAAHPALHGDVNRIVNEFTDLFTPPGTANSTHPQPGQYHPNYHPCNYCLQSFHSQDELLRHRKDKHPKLPNYDCDLCGKRFLLKGSMVRHRRLVHPGKGLRSPEKSRPTTRPRKCSLCSLTLENEQIFRAHLSAIHQIETFDCAVCRMEFMGRDAYDRHLKKGHGNPLKMFRFN